MILKKIWQLAKRHPYFFLFAFGVVVRVLVYILYNGHVSMFNDSGGYFTIAEMIKSWNFNGYNGTRTPGYPFLIYLADLSGPLTTIYQSILGILTSFMLFYIFFKQSKNLNYALVVGLIPSIFMHLLFYERAILTESLTLSCLVFCVWVLFKTGFFTQRLSFFTVFLIGIAATMVLVVRPMFIILPPFIAFYYVVLNFKNGIFHNIISVLLICFPAFTFYSLWSSFNETHTGYKAITSYSGINTAQTTVFFVQNADNKYAKIRDLHIRKRDSVIANGSDPAMAIWHVFADLERKDSITVAEFSQLLIPMNIDLIKNNKLAYLKRVTLSWIDFWGTGVMWNYESFPIKEIKWVLAGFWLFIMTPIVLFLKILFLIICAFHFYKRIRNRKLLFTFEFFCVLLILGASVGQAIVTFGSNARFSMPFFPLILIVVIQFYLNNKKYVPASFRIKKRRYISNR
ncbi:hypothetical protein [Aequorivita marisscotiae]|uniref:Glycosyltransferase RgtA/B/C/D-like domain-containing protein n=1 Tax=Aequorivita marisscotiae TaxID=3040348 RepID=A0ABY8KU78_9FLAO|nr:hypothetical protein [Aequorivita sp. Ant34-E75]WGF91296.1 hypothetical protein QCQ61_08695 [Aequorivita sp. Ant34-E75]